MAREKSFENKIKAYLKDIGAWYIKYWAGAKYTKEGIPDILACIGGRFFGIEVKGPNGKPSMLQLITLREIRASGGYGVLLYPDDFDRFKDFVNGRDPQWYINNIQEQDEWRSELGFY